MTSCIDRRLYFIFHDDGLVYRFRRTPTANADQMETTV